MTDKETIHKVLSSLWKNDDDIRYIYYNQALQDAQTAFDSLPEEPVSEDLNKVSKEYADKNYAEWLDFCSGDECDDHYPISEAFKAGAQWQKQQMMKDAPEAVFGYGNFALPEDFKKQLKYGDKIKLIIIKDK